MKDIIPLNTKRLAILAVAWTVLVIAWAILAEPYGSKMSNRDWEDFSKVVLTPPVALAILNLLSDQFFKAK